MGEVFAGRYELIEPVAVGGMGSVWQVLDQADGQVKAAKILRQSDAASLLRFVREQSMRIDHTHVVTPLSWAGMDDRVLFTMPLVRGGSVAGLVAAHGALPLPWVARLTDQTLQALEAVHAAGIVHRDVKPANLLLEPTGRGEPHLRLTDFGIAAPVDEPRMTRASMAIGTPGYMAPEQWHGADPDPRADVYAVGRVALEMLTGERPRAEQQADDLASRRTGDPHHDALLLLIGLATAPDPAHRPSSAADLRAELGARGLLALSRAGDDPVSIEDQFALGTGPRLPPPPPPPYDRDATEGVRPSAAPTQAPLGTSVLRPSTPQPTQVQHRPVDGASRSVVPGVVLLVVGVLGLAVALWLLLG